MVATGDHFATAIAAAQVLGVLPQETRHVLISSRLGTAAGPGTQSLGIQPTSQQAAQAVAPGEGALPAHQSDVQPLQQQPFPSMQAVHTQQLLSQAAREQPAQPPLSVRPSQLTSYSAASPSTFPIKAASEPEAHATLQPGSPEVLSAEPAAPAESASGDAAAGPAAASAAGKAALLAAVQADVTHHSLDQSGSAELLSLQYVFADKGDFGIVSAQQGLRLLAEGYMCILTGPALAVLMQHAEPAVLELILRSTSVCAHMRAAHKKHLMQLLGSQGVTLHRRPHLKVMLPRCNAICWR